MLRGTTFASTLPAKPLDGTCQPSTTDDSINDGPAPSSVPVPVRLWEDVPDPCKEFRLYPERDIFENYENKDLPNQAFLLENGEEAEWTNKGVAHHVAWMSFEDEVNKKEGKIQIFDYMIKRYAEPLEIENFREVGKSCEGFCMNPCKPLCDGLSFLDEAPLSMTLSILSYYFHVPDLSPKPLKVRMDIGGPTVFIICPHDTAADQISILHHDGKKYKPFRYSHSYNILDRTSQTHSERRIATSFMLHVLRSPLDRQPRSRVLAQEQVEAAQVIIVVASVAEATFPSLNDVDHLIKAKKHSRPMPRKIKMTGRGPGLAPVLLRHSLRQMHQDGSLTFENIFGYDSEIFCFARNAGTYAGRAFIVGRPPGINRNFPEELSKALYEIFDTNSECLFLQHQQKEFESLLTAFSAIPGPPTMMTAEYCEVASDDH